MIGQFADQIDPPAHRERSFCCGAGGGQMFLGEEKGKRINLARAEELAALAPRRLAPRAPSASRCSAMR